MKYVLATYKNYGTAQKPKWSLFKHDNEGYTKPLGSYDNEIMAMKIAQNLGLPVMRGDVTCFNIARYYRVLKYAHHKQN